MNYKVLDLFCGCGGLSEGFRLAGFDIMGGIDFNQSAIDTYKYNFKDATAICADLSKFSDDDISYHYPDLHKLDIIIGGPPCQGFSNANRYQSEDEDPRNRLFFEFVKFVDRANPKVVLIENVKGLITLANGIFKDDIVNRFGNLGYKVTFKILNAADYGVPQNRYRVFFVGKKNGQKFEFPDKYPYQVSTSEALSDLPTLEDGITKEKYEKETITDYQRQMRNNQTNLFNHEPTKHTEVTKQIISKIPDGGSIRDLPDDFWNIRRYNKAFQRMNSLLPSNTVDTGHRNYFHYKENRIPSVRENARLQSFPDDFIFYGSKTSQYKQVGNAVPPLLAYAIAKQLRKDLENETRGM